MSSTTICSSPPRATSTTIATRSSACPERSIAPSTISSGRSRTKPSSTYAPFINAHAGSNLDSDAIKYIFEEVDPFYLWQDQERIWTDRDYSLNYHNIYEYQLKKYREAGTIADRDYDLDDFFQAKSIWQEMRDHKDNTERLLQKAATETLSPDRQELVNLAQQHHEIYNYLDASRFAEAAFA